LKLASLRDGSRDGLLLVVSRDLSRAVPVPGVSTTLQAALDDWTHVRPGSTGGGGTRVSCRRCVSFVPPSAVAARTPLGRRLGLRQPRRTRAQGAGPNAAIVLDRPAVYQGGSDDFLPPCADAPFASEEHGIDLEAEVAVVTDDVPMGTSAADARQHVQLLMLVNDWSLRNLIPAELAKGFGFYLSKPATAFSPVAVTPDELGADWDGGKVLRPLASHVNGALRAPDAGVDMTFDFPRLIEHVTGTTPRRGAIVGSGTVQLRPFAWLVLPRTATKWATRPSRPRGARGRTHAARGTGGKTYIGPAGNLSQRAHRRDGARDPARRRTQGSHRDHPDCRRLRGAARRCRTAAGRLARYGDPRQ
jgi:fumarylacetoacetate (FAA) hydrolase